jgi:hypothetical protein
LKNDLVSLKNSTVRKKSQALATYMFWLKTGLDYRTIASVFSLEEFQNVGNYCNQVRDSMLKDFVPNYLGAAHLPREEWKKHNTDIVKELFFDNNDQFAIIADGTYIYCQKSNNNYLQRKLFSIPKMRHLVKPFVICSTDGLILDIYGLFPAVDNDAKIIEQVLKTDRSLRHLLKPGDHVLVDRGFYTSIDELKTKYQFQTHIPTCVRPKQKLKTLEANQTRFVTKCRWPVEAVNVLLKTLYRANDKKVYNVTLPHVLSDLRIAGALINRFHKRLFSDKDNSTEIAQQMKLKLNTVNELENVIDTFGLDRKRVAFEKSDANTISHFPKIDKETIKNKITLGTYQLKQSLNYLAEHQRENGNFTIEVFADKERIFHSNRRLLRARLQSRHLGRTKYNTYITYWPNEDSIDKIDGWLCTCRCCKRTVGCCSHVASLIYYLSYGRYHNSSNPAASLTSIFPIPTVLESSDEDDESINETQIVTNETEVLSNATEIQSDATEEIEIQSDSNDETEQYVSIYPNLSIIRPSQTSITIAESSDEDDVLTDEILSDVAGENSREQYIPIYPDLSNLMELP